MALGYVERGEAEEQLDATLDVSKMAQATSNLRRLNLSEGSRLNHREGRLAMTAGRPSSARLNRRLYSTQQPV